MSIDKLKAIANGQSQNTPKASEEFLKTQNRQSEDVISKLGHLTPEDRYTSWRREIGDSLQDAEYKWQTREKLYPGSDFKEHTLKNIDLDIKAQRSARDTYTYFQREYSGWSSWLQDHYREAAESTIPYLQQEELSMARINNKLATRDVLSSQLKDLNFSGTQSVRAHAEDISKALKAGHTKLHTDGNGRVAIPMDGELVPVFTLEDSADASPLEELILLRDTKNLIEEIISPSVTASQNDFKAGIRANNRELFRRLFSDTSGDLKEFEDDIIYNAARDELNQFETAFIGLKNSVMNGDHANPWDALAQFIHRAYKFGQTIDKRSI